MSKVSSLDLETCLSLNNKLIIIVFMKKGFFLITLITCIMWQNLYATSNAEFAVAEFSSDTYTWIANNLRATFINNLNSQGKAIENIANISPNNGQLLQMLKNQGYKYLVRGKVLATINTSQQTKIYSYQAKGLVDKTVYNSNVYFAISYVSCETGQVVYSTVSYNQSIGKESQEEAMKDASVIKYPSSLLPEEYRLSLGKIVSLGESSKKGVKTVFATISYGWPYDGRTYDVYEQIPSEEWGFDTGDMFLSKIGELKVKERSHEGESIELKVTKGEKEIKDIFDAGIHQIIIK